MFIAVCLWSTYIYNESIPNNLLILLLLITLTFLVECPPFIGNSIIFELQWIRNIACTILNLTRRKYEGCSVFIKTITIFPLEKKMNFDFSSKCKSGYRLLT